MSTTGRDWDSEQAFGPTGPLGQWAGSMSLRNQKGCPWWLGSSCHVHFKDPCQALEGWSHFFVG